MNKIKNTLVLTLIAIIVACSSKPIVKESFEGYSEVKEGGQAVIKWHFKNVDEVRVEGIRKSFNPVDSFIVRPVVSTKYKISAIQGDDSLNMDWRVIVEEIKKDIQTGIGTSSSYSISPSYQESEYLSGIISASMSISTKKLKIMRTVYPDNSGDDVNIRFILTDAFGNQIEEIRRYRNADLSSSVNCGNDNLQISKILFDEFKFAGEDQPHVAHSIIIENSAAAEDNSSVFNSIKDYLHKQFKQDRFSISVFNQNLYNLSDFAKTETALFNFDNAVAPAAQGLNALYKSTYKTLADLKENGNGLKKLLTLIVYSPDNASIIYETQDIAEFARKSRIPVYIISVGSAIDSYPLRYICGYTGGRYYHINKNNLAQLSNILNEINISQKTYYEFEFPAKELCPYSGLIKAKFNFETQKAFAVDEVKLYFEQRPHYSRYQSLAVFNYKETGVRPVFYEVIESLARVLKDNPDKSIRLTGHARDEGNLDEVNKIAYLRAVSVKDKLIEYGTSPEQIKIKNAGNSSPLYYFQEKQWQQLYNRRVEVRWLDPATLPFEIAAQMAESESLAIQKVEEWEKRGFRSYYQRTLSGELPSYKVKIWGYPTEQEAKSAARKIEQKYDVSLSVE